MTDPWCVNMTQECHLPPENTSNHGWAGPQDSLGSCPQIISIVFLWASSNACMVEWLQSTQ